MKRSHYYDEVSDEEVTRRKGLVERLRDRRRHLTRGECRGILFMTDWNLDKALESTEKNQQKFN